MTSIISLEGLQSFDGGLETRSLAHLKVDYNGQSYDWQIFVPPLTELAQFLIDSQNKIESEIDAKELEWSTLEPKYTTYTDPMTNEEAQYPITKESIVKPDIPDYYAKRRVEYPSIAEQLGAIWKGQDSDEYKAMVEKIALVKETYPK
jgi:hypothetical protein